MDHRRQTRPLYLHLKYYLFLPLPPHQCRNKFQLLGICILTLGTPPLPLPLPYPSPSPISFPSHAHTILLAHALKGRETVKRRMLANVKIATGFSYHNTKIAHRVSVRNFSQSSGALRLTINTSRETWSCAMKLCVQSWFCTALPAVGIEHRSRFGIAHYWNQLSSKAHQVTTDVCLKVCHRNFFRTGSGCWRTSGYVLANCNLNLQQQSSSSSSNRFYWTRRFDPETRAFFGYTSKLSKQIHLYFFVALSIVRLPSRRIRQPRCTQRLTSWAFQGV